jgi:hypothetical protein
MVQQGTNTIGSTSKAPAKGRKAKLGKLGVGTLDSSEAGGPSIRQVGRGRGFLGGAVGERETEGGGSNDHGDATDNGGEGAARDVSANGQELALANVEVLARGTGKHCHGLQKLRHMLRG